MKIEAKVIGTQLQRDPLPDVAESLRLLGKQRRQVGWFQPHLKPKAWRLKLPTGTPTHVLDRGAWAMNNRIPEGKKRHPTMKSELMLTASSTRQPNDCLKDNSLFDRTCRMRKSLA